MKTEQVSLATNKGDEDTLQRFIVSLGQCEGYGVAGAIPTVNKNPGNIRNSTVCEKFSGHNGKNGFCVFPTEEDGYNAIRYVIKKYYSNMTLSKTMNRWSPPSENNTNRHTRCISDKSGIGFNDNVFNS